MFLFLDISTVFCVYFPVDLEVFYLGHAKKPLYNTIQYNRCFDSVGRASSQKQPAYAIPKISTRDHD